MQRLYAGIDEDPEAIIETAAMQWKPERTTPFITVKMPTPQMLAAAAKTAPAAPRERQVELGEGMSLRLRYVPAGEFTMGDAAGLADEKPVRKMRSGGFWSGQFEITNEQYALFDPKHDSKIERSDFLHFSDEDRGWRVNGPKQPVCRVTWQQAMEFCNWLSKKTGEHFRLPTEAEWEYAARGGSQSQMWFGDTGTDFRAFANLADYMLLYPPSVGRYIPAWRPAVASVNDGYRVSAPAGSYDPNQFGLYDMLGNVAEWTLSTYRPYPYNPADGRDDAASAGRKVVRGGSWYDRPEYARSAFRKAYHPWQGVFDVGFRVIVEDAPLRLSSQRRVTLGKR